MRNDKYVLYAPSIEVTQPREAELINKIVRSLDKTNRSSFARYHHGIAGRTLKATEF
jgi:hypothetical protein